MPFTDDNYFVIDDPQQVGAMWNYHYNDHTHLTIGPDGSGMSLSREPNITVWNRPFRWLYLRDRQSGEVWCPAWALSSDLDAYECRHGPTDTVISSRKSGIGSKWRATLAQQAMAELWTWSLANSSDKPVN